MEIQSVNHQQVFLVLAVGDVLDGKFIVLKNIVGGTFDDTGLFDSSTISLNIVLNTNATLLKVQF